MDAENALNPTPQRRAAREALAEVGKGGFAMHQYLQVVQQFQMLHQRHGLGQALAFLQLRAAGKSTSPYHLLARQLDRWLLTTLAVSARSALAALAARDSRFYREASEQARLFARALRAGAEEAP